jgi:hypothetical protein
MDEALSAFTRMQRVIVFDKPFYPFDDAIKSCTQSILTTGIGCNGRRRWQLSPQSLRTLGLLGHCWTIGRHVGWAGRPVSWQSFLLQVFLLSTKFFGWSLDSVRFWTLGLFFPLLSFLHFHWSMTYESVGGVLS